MRPITAVIAGLIAISGASAATEPPISDLGSAASRTGLEAACKETACRPEQDISQKLGGGRSVSWHAPASPYVDKNGALYVLPGEMLVFHVEVKEGERVAPVFLRSEPPPPPGDVSLLNDQERKNAAADKDNEVAMAQAFADWHASKNMRDRLKDAPPGTLFVYYRQIPNGASMILETGHNLEGTLKFDASIGRFGRQLFVYEHSSTCGAISGLGSLETWPYPLGPILLGNFRLLPGKVATCE